MQQLRQYATTLVASGGQHLHKEKKMDKDKMLKKLANMNTV
jgi:hypothetical protein